MNRVLLHPFQWQGPRGFWATGARALGNSIKGPEAEGGLQVESARSDPPRSSWSSPRAAAAGGCKCPSSHRLADPSARRGAPLVEQLEQG